MTPVARTYPFYELILFGIFVVLLLAWLFGWHVVH
jgi:hypothetical protein